MNTPKPNEAHTALRQALHRDAEHLPKPPFDPALHSATMRRIRALSNEEPMHYRWSAVRAGMAAASLLIFIMVTMPLWHRPADSTRVHSAQTYPGQQRNTEGDSVTKMVLASPVTGTTGVGKPQARNAKSAFSGSERVHGNMVLDLASFADQRLKYAMLDAGLSAESAGRFPLDVPTGPMRLDCAYSSTGNDPADSLFGRFNFNVSN